MELATQYDQFAQTFSSVHDAGENSNRDNRCVFYKHIDFIKPGMRVLDLGCGDGLDLEYYRSLGAEIYGLDASSALISIAKGRLPNADIRVGLFEEIPFPNDYFDAVLSKYAIQTSADMQPCFREIHRVLKPHGIMLYLVTHPFRQFIEKKIPSADYFTQSVVNSCILNGAVTVQEPSHTLNEYLSNWLFKKFEVQHYSEHWDAAAEMIGDAQYPGYFILKAIKRPAITLAVFSSADPTVSEENKILARHIGEYLAEKNVTVATGGSNGIPGLVIKAAFEKDAETTVYSPDTDEISHHARHDNLPLHYFKKHVFVQGFTARSLEMLKNVDGVLVLNGRMGTLSEFSIALEEGVRTVVIINTGGISDHLENLTALSQKKFPQKIIFETDYKKAIDALLADISLHREFT